MDKEWDFCIWIWLKYLKSVWNVSFHQRSQFLLHLCFFMIFLFIQIPLPLHKHLNFSLTVREINPKFLYFLALGLLLSNTSNALLLSNAFIVAKVTTIIVNMAFLLTAQYMTTCPLLNHLLHLLALSGLVGCDVFTGRH